MVENSTFFFIYDNINEENELYTCQELMETDKSEVEIAKLLNKIKFSPPDEILQKIFERIF